MENDKLLKGLLVVIIVVSAIMLGYSTYKQNVLQQKVATFADSIGKAQNEAEARSVITAFLDDTNARPLANSASAGKWWCLWLCGGGGGSGSGGEIPHDDDYLRFNKPTTIEVQEGEIVY